MTWAKCAFIRVDSPDFDEVSTEDRRQKEGV